MKFKTGDKVKFLNENGGGVVSKIISSKLVYVKIEDGFEIPTMVSELVKIEDSRKMAGQMFQENFSGTFRENGIQDEEEQDYHKVVFDDRSSKLEIFQAKGKNKRGVYLAFVPQEQRWLITGLLDIFIVNYTDYDILFSLFLRKPTGAFEGTDYDSVGPNTKILLNTIERENIEKWSSGIIQILYYKDLDTKVLSPANCNFNFKPSKLYKENNYHTSSFMSEKAFLLMLNEIAVQAAVANSPEGEKYEKEHKLQQAKQTKPKQIIDKHRTSPREAVIDLHIGELVENYSKMSNAEMLNYQLNYFVKCIESAISNFLTKLIFIHGVGDGVLKNKMYEILKEYDNIQVKDASMKKFGYGATEVLIWHRSFV